MKFEIGDSVKTRHDHHHTFVSYLDKKYIGKYCVVDKQIGIVINAEHIDDIVVLWPAGYIGKNHSNVLTKLI